MASQGEIAQWWIDNAGVTPQAARAIARSVNVESGGKPLEVNPTSGALGTHQWLGPRKAALTSLPNWQDWRVQQQFALSEYQGGDPQAARAWDRIKNATDEHTAYRLVRDNFARGEDSAGYIAAHGGTPAQEAGIRPGEQAPGGGTYIGRVGLDSTGLSPVGSALLGNMLKDRYGAAEEPTGNSLLDGLLKSSLFGTTEQAPQPSPTDVAAKPLQQFTPPPPPQTVPELQPGQPIPTPRIQPIQQPAMPSVPTTPMPGQPSVPRPPVQQAAMPLPGGMSQEYGRQGLTPPSVTTPEPPTPLPGTQDRNRFWNPDSNRAPYNVPGGPPDDRMQMAGDLLGLGQDQTGYGASGLPLSLELGVKGIYPRAPYPYDIPPSVPARRMLGKYPPPPANEAANTGNNLLNQVLKQVSPISTAQAAETGQPAIPRGMVPGNIDLHARPVVRNPDGSISTVRSMSFNEDGKEVLIPTVAADGSRILTPREAIDQYHRTGQFLGKFDTPEEADAYGQRLHEEQAKEYAPQTQQAPPANTGNSLLDNILKTAGQLPFVAPFVRAGQALNQMPPSAFASPLAEMRKEGWQQLAGAPISDPADPRSLAKAALDLEHGPAMDIALGFAGGGEGRIPRSLSHVEPPPLRTEPPPIGGGAGGRPPEGPPPEGPKPPEPGEGPQSAKPDLIDRLMRRTPEVKAAIGDAQALDDDLHALRQKSQKDMIVARQLVEDLPPELLDPKVQEQVYHEAESLMTGKPEPQSPATTKLLTTFKGWTDRLFDNVKWLHENAADVAQELPEADLRRAEEGYVHRKRLGKNIPGERLDPSTSEVITGGGRSLPRRASAAQHRSGEYMLEDNAGNRFYQPGPRVGEKGGPSYGQKVEDRRTGTVYTVKEATTREIEHKYGGKELYSKNWVANMIDGGLRAQRVVDATKLLQEKRAQMIERGNFIEDGGSVPVGDRRKYVRVDLPQFHGWMQQHHADVLNRFYRTSQGAILDYIEKASKYIIGSMFALPVRHIENVGAHYVVGRGFDNLYSNPHLASAIREVAGQGPRYLKLLEQGAGLQLPSVLNENFYETMLQKLFHDQMLDPEWHNIAARVGMKLTDLVKAEYAWSRKSLWKWNDVFLTARIFELEGKGMTTAQAIKAAEKEIPNYRIPVEVMRSRFLSQLLQSPFIAFGRYGYGRGRAIAEMIKDMVGPHATGEERVRAIGQATVLAALGTGGYQLANSALNKALQVSGIRKEDDPPMGLSGFGPFGIMRTGMTLAGVPTDIPQLSQTLGDPIRDPATREWRDELATLITPNPVITTPLEFAFNTDFFRRRPMIDPESSAKGQVFQAGEGVLGSLYPFQVALDMAQRGVVPGLGTPFGLRQETQWQPSKWDLRRGGRREARDPFEQFFMGGGDSGGGGEDVDAAMNRARADVASGKIGEAENALKNLGLSPFEIKSLIQTYQKQQAGHARPAR